eukprot:1160783-Pelagomonas_calceolata.AAC.3
MKLLSMSSHLTPYVCNSKDVQTWKRTGLHHFSARIHTCTQAGMLEPGSVKVPLTVILPDGTNETAVQEFEVGLRRSRDPMWWLGSDLKRMEAQQLLALASGPKLSGLVPHFRYSGCLRVMHRVAFNSFLL